MSHFYVRLLGIAAALLLVSAAAFAAPQPGPSAKVTRVLQSPVIKQQPFSYGKYVTYTDPNAFLRNPNLPDKAIEKPKGNITRRELLESAIVGTGFMLEMDEESQKILARAPGLYIATDRLTAADVIDSAVRVTAPMDALDYSIQGKTIKVFPAAKDADGFTLRRVSVDAKDASLQDVLTDILGQTGYRLFVPMRLNTKITVQCRDVTIGEAIRAVLAAAPGNLESVRMTSGRTGQTLFIEEVKPQAK